MTCFCSWRTMSCTSVWQAVLESVFRRSPRLKSLERGRLIPIEHDWTCFMVLWCSILLPFHPCCQYCGQVVSSLGWRGFLGYHFYPNWLPDWGHRLGSEWGRWRSWIHPTKVWLEKLRLGPLVWKKYLFFISKWEIISSSWWYLIIPSNYIPFQQLIRYI